MPVSCASAAAMVKLKWSCPLFRRTTPSCHARDHLGVSAFIPASLAAKRDSFQSGGLFVRSNDLHLLVNVKSGRRTVDVLADEQLLPQPPFSYPRIITHS